MLIYLTLTRPNISFYVHVLSQYMHDQLQSHLSLAFKVLRYLKGAPGKGVNVVKDKGFSLKAFCDEDQGKCKLNRKSVYGYLVYFCNSLVSWKSKKQAIISRSSIEAEYRAMATTACELTWIVNRLKGLNVKTVLPIELYCDNNSSIQIVANPVLHEKQNTLNQIFIL